MDEFVSIVEKLAGQIVLHELKDILKQSVERLLVRADHGDSQERTLQEILISHFRG